MEDGRWPEDTKPEVASPTSTEYREKGMVDDERKKRNKSVAASKEKRRKKNSDAAIFNTEVRGGDPAVIFRRGNANKRDKTLNWFRPISDGLVKLSKSEVFGDTQRKGMPPAHIYSHMQYCKKSIVPGDCRKIKELSNAQMGIQLQDCTDFDSFLNEISSETCAVIKEKPEFQGAAIAFMRDNDQREWYSCLKAAKEDGTFNATTAVEDAMRRNPGLKNLLEPTLGGASLHVQQEGTQHGISAYEAHRDKIGNIVCFYVVQGTSFNLLAMRSKFARKICNGKETAAIEPKEGSAQQYQRYKESLSGKDREMVEKFERDFLKEATRLELPRVRVYQMKTADKLVFPARVYFHGTIIPAQENGRPRVLLVFHDVDPIKQIGTTK
jgi:hypothetical protein